MGLLGSLRKAWLDVAIDTGLDPPVAAPGEEIPLRLTVSATRAMSVRNMRADLVCETLVAAARGPRAADLQVVASARLGSDLEFNRKPTEVAGLMAVPASCPPTFLGEAVQVRTRIEVVALMPGG